MADKYTTFKDLLKGERRGVDYDLAARRISGAKAIVIAPHGGTIEPRSEKIAEAIAGKELSFYCFKALKANSGLHVKSHLFDEPTGVEAVANHDQVISIHGWGEAGERICVGGRDKALIALLRKVLAAKGIEVEAAPQGLTALDPNNITNRGRRSAGVQFELTMGFRKNSGAVRKFVDGVRSVLLAQTAIKRPRKPQVERGENVGIRRVSAGIGKRGRANKQRFKGKSANF